MPSNIHLAHTLPCTRAEKGWGYEIWFANSPLYCGKLLHFDKGKCCSMHFHKLKDETFYLVSGRLRILRSDRNPQQSPSSVDSIMMLPGDNMHIPVGTYHQIIGMQDSDLIEASTEHFEEDSIRVWKGN